MSRCLPRGHIVVLPAGETLKGQRPLAGEVGTGERSEKAKKWLPGIQIDLASCPAKEKWRP